ncbi:MAG: MATE family efflux transporter [Rhodocyclaceae bacterium]
MSQSLASRPQPRLFSVTWPIFAEQFLSMLGGAVLVWRVSQISDDTAAAFALANQIFLTFMLLFRIVSIGASVVVTQYLGAGDRVGAERIARAALAGCAWTGVLCGVVVMLGAQPLLRLMHLPPSLDPIAMPYLIALGLGLVFDALNLALSAVARAYAYTRSSLLISVMVLVVHLGLGLLLMAGVGPLPAMGVMGLGIALILSRIVGLATGLYLWRAVLEIRPRLADMWHLRRRELGEMLHIGLPAAAENIAYRLSFMIILSFVAAMGPAALATHSYTFPIMSFILLAGLTIGFGTEIIVGHRIGAGRLHEADHQVHAAMRWGLGITLGVALLAALAGKPLLRLFTQDEQIVEAGAQLLWLCLLLEPGRTFNLVVINGLRATGDARFPVLAGVVSMFVVAVGLAWWLGVHLGWGLPGVWLAFAADEWIRGLSMAARWHWRGWLGHAHATRRRVRGPWGGRAQRT